ncbi:bifunctional hydroxymethylpyrimidine kinase/phosphomethylpyrimidine kinase [Arcobacter arenosus]|uniref:hydroxymethylpyrimidine kinase n=1 Tax=Arcobacter arenosus TaxID=2576037 RepID=A0A5R8XZ24_9BACT|nr:bifunctional hydroxymethylpyrimidine kinase/phosphomethylpyrimidine kinase [Arcobacter arenosus]TLP37487.1 bifunctional hydroxymethylpyrimidine kinase/phosphomethylpyrimidine kinase [Arcobacter arenosus]
MKVVLTIAGSDSSGGAGIQADLKTFENFGVFGASVLTVLTAQNTTGVKSISQIDSNFVREQLEMVFDDFEVAAVKIGMLFSNEIIDTVREFIKNLDIPIVLDPVFVSKAGSKLLSDDAVENMKSLFPYVTLITPNTFEAKGLFNFNENNNSGVEEIKSLPCKVLIKNIKKGTQSIDRLYSNENIIEFESAFLNSENTHGTGCSFSSAIAANIALGKNLEDAISVANKFVFEAIKNAPELGKGKGPIAHKKGFECL